MKLNFGIGALTCTAIALVAGQANATSTLITCTDSAAGDPAAWSAALGGPTYPSLASGAVIQITGICSGDYNFKTSGVTFENSTGVSSVSATDGFDGMVEINGAHVTFNGITLKGTSLDPTHSSTATNSSNATEVANLFLHDGAAILLENSQVGPGTLNGIQGVRSVSATILNSTISGNGSGGFSTSLSSGIFFSDGSAFRLGNTDGTNPGTVQGNGTYTSGVSCHGNDILLSQTSSASLYNATIGGTTSGTGANCGEIYAQAASSVIARDIMLGHFGGFLPAIEVIGGSAIRIDQNQSASGGGSGSVLTGVADGSSVSTGVLLVGGASSAILEKTTLTTPSTGQAALEATANSTIILAGGNTIHNTGTGGVAIQIDHSSSMVHLKGTIFGYGLQAETVIGDGIVQVQSSMDIGQGASSTISWATSTGGISVQQNSSFRVSGGVSITGGSVVISQGSNGFANTGNGGGTNALNASCPFTNVPSAHWAAPTKVTPTVPTATSYASAVSPDCLVN